MNRELNTSLISTILQHIPDRKNSAAYIAKILDMEQEYVYRRLRGKTSFTLEETVRLSKELKFSLDNLIGIKHDDVAVFNLSFLNKSELEDILSRKLEINIDLIKEVLKAERATVRWAGNTIPFMIFNNYPHLTKFFFYKWNYQKVSDMPYKSFGDLKFSKEFNNLLKTYKHSSSLNTNICLILDDNFMLSVIRNIQFFKVRGTLNEDETAKLKLEMHEILDKLEYDAMHGFSREMGKIEIYISSVNLSSSYTHVEYDNCSFSQFAIYTINTLNSEDKTICNMQKEWIESLKKTSTNITSCNEIERCKYFAKQRETINSIEYDLF